MNLLESLIIVSEKAANVARLCRQNEHLFQLLIQKKTCEEANPRFVEDFKTLADVLIQQIVKHDIGDRFPELRHSIYGEENNIFSNKLGETISVEIKENSRETAALLQVVLNDDIEAAELLAAEVHKEVSLDTVNTERPSEKSSISLEDTGVWIDPIDSTAEYINGIDEVAASGISISGLKCVTVLIGAYDKKTGLPLMGVVNQPFVRYEEKQWSGACFWGHATTTSLLPSTPPTRIICVSSSENPDTITKLKENGYSITEASGAGYKILTVITGLADAYILTKDSTFKWDTCGPQAILRALGGDIVVYGEATKGNIVSVKYTDGSNCNKGGIIVYRDEGVLRDIVKCLT